MTRSPSLSDLSHSICSPVVSKVLQLMEVGSVLLLYNYEMRAISLFYNQELHQRRDISSRLEQQLRFIFEVLTSEGVHF